MLKDKNKKDNKKLISKNRQIKFFEINIPQNINLKEENCELRIKNEEKDYELKVKLFTFLKIEFLLNKIKIYILPQYKKFKYAQIILITFTSKLRHQIKGVSEFYTGIINIKGLGYSVNVSIKKNKYHLFFRFGFKDTYNYIMPSSIKIENAETAKIHLIISTYSLELLKQVQRNIQRFRLPKAYKLQGIYLDNNFPKVKKYVK